jgi:transposase
MQQVLYVGLDWGHEESQIHAEWGVGDVVLRTRVPSTVDDLEQLVTTLREAADGAEIRVLLETKAGLIVQVLLGAGLAVYATNPKQVDRARVLWGVADAKDDTRDSEVLAWMLRCAEKAVLQITPPDAWLSQMRRLSRRHADLTQKCTQLTNQLSERLREGYPGALAFDLGTLSVLRVLRAVPSRAAAAAPQALETVRSVLSTCRGNRRSAEDVLAALQTSAPEVPEGDELFRLDITLLAQQLELALQHRRQIRERLDDLQASLVEADELTDARIVRSMPGFGPVITGTLFGEGLIALLRADLEMARAYAGVAPVRVVTGKRQTEGKPLVMMRRACSRACREALYHAAELRIQLDPSFRRRYRALRARGHRHGRACRQLGDALLAQLRAMLRDRTLFDPARWAA